MEQGAWRKSISTPCPMLPAPCHIMPDQAEKLRKLACDLMPRREVYGPPMVAVTGGKGGVGATTVAVNLAAALALDGKRVVLVDAARQNGDVAGVAGIDAEFDRSLGDVLAGRCSAGDALTPGPAGTLLLADRWSPEMPPDWSGAGDARLLAELLGLGPCADIVVVDTGSGTMPLTAGIWRQASIILAVTTVEDVAVMDTYATIKRSVPDMTAGADVRVLVNRCDSRRAADDACRRIANVCRRFLGQTVKQAPTLPVHAAASDQAGGAPPRVWEAPGSPYARSVNQLGNVVRQAFEPDTIGGLSGAKGLTY
jgi:flagellar biosynthesis protein FlhG